MQTNRLLGYASDIALPENAGQVRTHTIVIANAGRKAAANVHMCHGILPPSFSIWPRTPFTQEQYQGGAAIVLERIVPKE
jgi:uncharacterized repeat protein (TIGR01451 family)